MSSITSFYTDEKDYDSDTSTEFINYSDDDSIATELVNMTTHLGDIIVSTDVYKVFMMSDDRVEVYLNGVKCDYIREFNDMIVYLLKLHNNEHIVSCPCTYRYVGTTLIKLMVIDGCPHCQN